VIVIQQLSGANRGRRVEFSRGPVLLGRSPDAELRFDAYADIDVSARHAVLEITGDRWIIRDIGSRNGTFVGGKRVHERALVDRDEIELGHGGPRLFVSIPAASSPLEQADTEPGRALFEGSGPAAPPEVTPTPSSEEATRVVSHEAETVAITPDAPTVAAQVARAPNLDDLATRREVPRVKRPDLAPERDELERLKMALGRTRLALLVVVALIAAVTALLVLGR
jgi:hypothetical protein